jgi:hypothetical protein
MMLRTLFTRFQIQKGFDFLGKRILPIGVLPSQAALSRMQKNTVQLYEQGASKQRIWKYWVRWLGWAALAPSFVGSTIINFSITSDDSFPFATFALRCDSSGLCLQTHAAATFVTTDYSFSTLNSPVLIALPDLSPSAASYPASFYSFAKSNFSTSVPPQVTCSGGTVLTRTYSTTVALAAGTSCAITVTPQANGDPFAGVIYKGTLSNTGTIYTLTNGTVCGGPYSACASIPISAPIDLLFSKQPETYSTEIKLK